MEAYLLNQPNMDFHDYEYLHLAAVKEQDNDNEQNELL